MNTIQLKQTKNNRRAKSNTKLKLIKKYMDFAEVQGSQKVFWYMKAIIIIPCVFMVPSIMVMAFYSDIHEIYAGICMMLFFTNIMLHLASKGGKTFVPFYHFTLATMILIPAIAYLLS